MLSQDELIRTEEYWMEHIQVDIFNLVQDYMDEKDLNQSELAKELNYSKGYISQILNGNFNFSIRKLIRLCLSIGRVPILTFSTLKDFEKSKQTQWHNAQKHETIVRPLILNQDDANKSNEFSYG